MDSNKTLWEAVSGILLIVKNKEEDVLLLETTSYAKESYITTTTDVYVTNVVKDLTKFAANIVLREKRHSSELADEGWETNEKSCTCLQFINFGLPCRHIIKFPLEKGVCSLLKTFDILA